MRKSVCAIIGIIAVLYATVPDRAYPQIEKPVRIAFDKASERIDLLTGAKLPDYTAAQRGSIQFHRNRLDTPETTITFYHDGMKTVSRDQLILIEKVQPAYSIWRLRYKSGSKNTPRIHNKAISFIPLDTNGNPGNRVHVMLNDLTLIEWGE